MKVFLGGTTNDSTWRDYVIENLELDYFDPVVDDWNEEAFQRELEAKEECDFQLYVITPRMTGVYSIAEVVNASNIDPNYTVLVTLREDYSDINNTIRFDDSQWKSLQKVGEMVEANGAHWFNHFDDTMADLDDAIEFLNSYA